MEINTLRLFLVGRGSHFSISDWLRSISIRNFVRKCNNYKVYTNAFESSEYAMGESNSNSGQIRADAF